MFFVAYRQEAGDRAHGRMDGPRNPARIIFCRAQGTERIVAGEQLVAAIAAEGDRYMLPGKAREEICREQRPIAQRFVEGADKIGDQFSGLIEIERFFVVPRADVVGDRAGMPRFIESSAR